MKQVYLIHSADAAWVTRQREGLIEELVPTEMRDENLLELYSSTNQALKLASILPEILSELSTIPFLPDSRRVVVVHNLGDFLGGGRSRARRKKSKKPSGKSGGSAKTSPIDALASFMERDLPGTENALIFSLIIDPGRGEYLDAKGPLYQLISKSPLAEVIKPPYREQDPLFGMSDALLRRDALQGLSNFRRVFRDDSAGRVFNEILRNVRLLIQAIVLQKVESGGTSREVLESKYLPADPRLNLYKQPSFVQEKIRKSAVRFQLRELMGAMERLLEINRVLYPSQKDVYVPNLQLLLETFIIDFCEKRR